MGKKTFPPSVRKTAFECPYCGAFTTQYWYTVLANKREGDDPTPWIPDEDSKRDMLNRSDLPDGAKNTWVRWFDLMARGAVFVDENGAYANYTVNNLFLSRCYACNRIGVWVHDTLVFPSEKQGPMPNQDLPADVIQDFEEARSILSLSPKGAAAILRLCLQKICTFLGEDSKNLDGAIASLVTKGLNPLIQKSLDIVRVIGNEAVHPREINLNDDRETANQLFELVNSIADQMITHPKNVDQLYSKLPEGKRKAIEERNRKAGGK